MRWKRDFKTSIFLLLILNSNLFTFSFGSISSEYPQHGPWGEKIISIGNMLDYALSPDGNYLATTGVLGVYIWDTNTARIVRTLEGNSYIYLSVDFTPDSQQILTGCWDKTVKLWDVKTGNLIRTYDKHPDIVTVVSAMPNGTSFLSGDDSGLIRYVDLNTGEIIKEYKNSGNPREILIDPQEKYIYSVNGNIYRHNLETGEQTWIRIHNEGIYSMSLSQNGRIAVTKGRDQTAKLWDTESLQVIRTFYGLTKYFSGEIAISPNIKYVLMTDGDETFLLNSETGSIIKTIENHSQPVYRASFSKDGEFFFLASNYTIYMFKTDTATLIRKFIAHSIPGFSFTPDDQFVFLSDKSAQPKLFDINSGQFVVELNGHKSNAFAYAISKNGKIVITASTSKYPTIKVWEIFNSNLLTTLNYESSSLRFVSISPDDKWAISKGISFRDPIQIWDIFTGKIRYEINAFSALFLPNGKTFLTGQSDGDILWDFETGEKIKTFTNLKGTNYLSKFINENLLLQQDVYDTLSLWDLQLDKKIKEFETPSSYAFDFNQNKNILATIVKQPNVTIWDFQNSRVLGFLPGHWNNTSHIRFSSGGTSVFTSGTVDFTLRQWDISALVKNRSETPSETPEALSQEYAWLVLDGFGGIHTTDNRVTKPVLPYIESYNIIRDIEPDPLGRGWYMLDGFGGIHTSSPDLPKPKNFPYFFGFDFARNLEVKATDNGVYFYLLDIYGVVFSDDPNFERGNLPWFSEDRARDLEPSPYDEGWMMIDNKGNVYFSHQQWMELPLNETMNNVKGLVRFLNDTSVIMDGYGGRFTNPVFPSSDVVNGLSNDFYFPGFDIIWDVEAIPIESFQNN